MNNKMNINKLKAIMAENGAVQSDIAKLLGVSERCISNKMKERTEFKVSQLIKIANYFSVEPSIFLA